MLYEQIAAVVNDAVCQYCEQIGEEGGPRWEECCDIVKKGYTDDVAALVQDPQMSAQALIRKHYGVISVGPEERKSWELFVAIVRILC